MRRDNPLRVAYVVKMFPRLSETFILQELLELERRGARVQIFSLKQPTEAVKHLHAQMLRSRIVYLPERILPQLVRVLRGQWSVLRRFPRGYVRGLFHALCRRQLRSLAKSLRRFCQACCVIREAGDVRHLHAHFASDPARVAFWAHLMCGATYSVSTHAKDLFQDRRIESVGLQTKLRHAKFVVANSNFAASVIRASLNGAVSAPVETIHNGIDLAAFPSRSCEPQEPVVLAVGRLVAKKGFEDLILACDVLRKRGTSFQCNIVGSGPLEQHLQNIISDRGLQATVRLLGPRAHEQLYDCYARAKVFALPCVIYEDGDRDILPNVIKEAMAVGVAVVTTRLDGIEELVTDGQSGLLVPPGQPIVLADAIERLLGDAVLRSRLAAGARRVVEQQFDRRNTFGRLHELFWEVLDAPRTITAC